MAKAFQKSAFQSTYPGPNVAFQAVDRFVAVLNSGTLKVRDYLTIELGPFMLDYARTTAIVLECTIYDPSTTPPVLFDPGTVQLNLLRPDDTSELSLVAMSRISTGFYRYIWQTDGADLLGVYRANIKVTNGPNTAQTISQLAFNLVVITS